MDREVPGIPGLIWFSLGMGQASGLRSAHESPKVGGKQAQSQTSLAEAKCPNS